MPGQYNKPVRFDKALEKCVSLKAKQLDPNVIDALARFINQHYNRLTDIVNLSEIDTEDLSKGKKLKPCEKKGR